MAMQEETPTNKYQGTDRPLQGGRYACTEEELYKKALALLEKCKIEPGRLGQEIPELESAA
jgi:hypothetical protein